MRAIVAILALTIPLAGAPAMAKDGDSNERSPVGQAVDGVKEGGRAIGHGARDATKAIGHGTRDAVHTVGDTADEVTTEIGHGTRDAAKETGNFFTRIGHAFRDGWNDLTD
jgi:hypothetical protein